MQKYIYMIGAGLAALVALLFSAFRAGSNSQKVQNLKKEAKSDAKEKEMLSTAISGRSNPDRVRNKSKRLGARPKSNS